MRFFDFSAPSKKSQPFPETICAAVESGEISIDAMGIYHFLFWRSTHNGEIKTRTSSLVQTFGIPKTTLRRKLESLVALEVITVQYSKKSITIKVLAKGAANAKQK